MRLLRIWLPVVVAILFGWLTLIGLLLLPELGDRILTWAAFLGAVALVLGIVNLLVVHLKRARRNPYSVVLLVSMMTVFGLAITDSLGLTEDYVGSVFTYVQAPLEAALASLLAFFLLFIGFRLFRRSRSIWSALFLVSALFMLISQSPLPAGLNNVLDPIREFVNTVFVSAGMRGILIGVALGAVTLGLRLLVGIERPYNK